MSRKTTKILLTGSPGCGKTTVIMRVISGPAMAARGFYTEEVRGHDGRRIGFDVVTLSGRRGPLARVDADGPRVGRYGVCLDFLENSALPELSGREEELVIIDEIGKMECLSREFTQTVGSLLDSETPVIATIAFGGSAFIREVRARADIELVEVTKRNREVLAKELKKKVKV